ncbi:Scr1 family TA system antitoxin-like transcriptional regulator [Prauserella cavernicola]|uniref:Helix-turn-helix domain-containing protein n=1 Tax=Prauserella cavernicola TaxID=2800127 RepID=A0A934V2E7_9PSEU|nr:Scr1 family TA system antitoxin-like transcriptional regulator [Prauserella cavernicola]MBK1785591.1 helix-turn-helix domain-containing protein [Prauserella cavernicola]
MTAVREERIARELRRLRGTYTSTDVQRALGITPSKLSRIESCKVRPSPEDVRRLAVFYEADTKTVERLAKAAEELKRPVWWTEFVGPDWSSALGYHLELETEATRIESWTVDLVPGLMQTPDYASALITARVDVPADQLERRLELRVRRQQRVRDGSLELWVIVSEAVLHNLIGGAGVLRDQLLHLADAPSNVTVQVLPFSAGAHSGLGVSFHLLEFADWPTVGYQDTITQGLYYDDPDVVQGLARTVNDVRATALSPSASRAALSQRATELEG